MYCLLEDDTYHILVAGVQLSRAIIDNWAEAVAGADIDWTDIDSINFD